ncbi:hypothetical protein BLNAU_10956 [Blattamonas nauphoetae]|uniref:Uncharacterized protein n=1 Tax=Blattamonas nauphoetae TaxID=2049346 RepID=A0ABQ9XQT4_9EUKA|nr:hypothetical protein BLNAU_10956 [Blattamonas nauphoetae]
MVSFVGPIGILSRPSPSLDRRHTLLLLSRHSRTDRLLLWTPMRCHFRIDPHRRSSSTLRKGDRIKMSVHAHHPMTDLSPSRNEIQKEEMKREKRCDGNDAGHASLRPPNDLCAHQLFLTLIEAALLPQLLSILFAWLMGIAC